MSIEPPSRGWNILGAMFLIVGGLLLVVLGGLCSWFVGDAMMNLSDSSIWPFMLLSLATLAGGVALLYQAFRLLRQK